MRIGKVKNWGSINTFEKDDLIDKMAKSKWCNNCKEERLVLHLNTNLKTKMRVCINKKCFMYVEINRLITWII